MEQLFRPGGFFTGCNYWASHAGTNMWHDWNEEAVLTDFARLRDADVRVLRVFPLWSDFQPLRMHLGGGGVPKQLRMGEDMMPDTPAGRAGMDEIMLERFEWFADEAEKHGLKLVVGLLTGWMSGRLYVPEAFQSLNVLTDPLALKWEIKFVRCMVHRFREHPAIAAWDLGNECNCMAPVSSSEQAYVWLAAISMAIRAEDGAHPVVSGMHSLRVEGSWLASDQGELMDVLCTHPYPIFTPHCDTDPINRTKSALHAVAETRLYADLGGKPAFAEETGTLGPMIASEDIAADYIRSILFSLWAHDCHGLMWWCANEQIHLTHTPYDWGAVERELGLMRADGSPKPVLGELTAFSRFLRENGVDALPPCLTDAVCVLTQGQDQWAAAYGAFLLAKQSGLDIRFAYSEQATIPDAGVYMLPSLHGYTSLSRHAQMDLLARVHEGATLYLSVDNPLLSPFTDFTGLRVRTRARRLHPDEVEFAGARFTLDSEFVLSLECVTATPLAVNGRGEPVFTVNQYGKGKVYFLNFPIETIASTQPGVISGEDAMPLHLFYRAMRLGCAARTASNDDPAVGITEHPAGDGRRLLTVVNYEPDAREARVSVKGGWRATDCRAVHGAIDWRFAEGEIILYLPGNSGALVTLTK